jgi:hypothetical protein
MMFYAAPVSNTNTPRSLPLRGHVLLERVVHAGLPPRAGGAEKLKYVLRDSKRGLRLLA